MKKRSMAGRADCLRRELLVSACGPDGHRYLVRLSDDSSNRDDDLIRLALIVGLVHDDELEFMLARRQ